MIRCERVGRKNLVELDCLGLTQEGLRLLIAGRLRSFHELAQPTERIAGLRELTEPVLGQSQEGEVGRFSPLVHFV